MLSVTLYEFKKRENSTKRPDSSATQRTHNAVLKTPTSLLRPEISFDFGLKGNPSFYNYAYISDLGNRYYFIRDWTVSEGHIWTAHMEVDVLASWKASIGNSIQYVTRSSYKSNGKIVDSLYPAMKTPTREIKTLDNPFVTSFSGGSYVVGIINNDNDSAVGAVHYYVFSQSEFNSFCSYLLGRDWTGISDISEELTKALFNPFQYIVSCVWFPLTIPTKGKISSMRLGWWTLPVAGGGTPQATILTAWANFTIPKHPQSSVRGSFLNSSPYSSYELFYPGIGNINIDANILSAYSALGTLLQIDIVGNTARLSLLGGTTEDATPIKQIYTQFGVPIQLAQLSSKIFSNIGTAATSLVNGAKDYATGNIAGTIASGASFISSAIDSLNPKVDSLNSNGSLLSTKSNIILVSEFYLLTNEDNEDRGRPLCEKVELSSIPGYQVIADPDLAIAGTSEENREIKNYLAGGYFYE